MDNNDKTKKGAAHMVLGMAVPKPDASKPVPRTLEGILYAAAIEEPGAGVRVSRFVKGIVASLQDATDDGVLEGLPPEDDFYLLWRIDIWVRSWKGDRGDAFMDWSAALNCPYRQRGMMMDFVAALRKTGVKSVGRARR